MSQRTMLILWHWDPLRSDRRTMDVMPVEDDPAAQIIRVDEQDLDQITYDMRAALSQATSVPERPASILVFLHRSALNDNDFNRLLDSLQTLPAWKQVHKYRSFGGGQDFLYYKPEFDSGLLNQSGHFANESDLFEIPEPVSVIQKDRNGEWQVKYRYFDEVWQHYTYECKRLVYEFWEDLNYFLIDTTGSSFNGQRLDDLLAAQIPDLSQRLENLCGGVVSPELLTRIYHQHPFLPEKYKGLVHFLKEERLGPDYLFNARSHFDAVLDEIPGLTY